MELFDIVICLGPLDRNKINTQLKFTKKNVIGFHKIFIITKVNGDSFLNKEHSDCIIIDENIFPFGFKDLARSDISKSRRGWYLQQLLKLYAGIVIPNILNKYLVIDADTYFLQPTKFISNNNKPMYNFGYEYNKPYFDHMKRLHSSLTKNTKHSGICHHMMFDTIFVKKMFKLIEETYQDRFWKIFIDKLPKKEWLVELGFKSDSRASEYELYFNYMLTYHRSEIEIRKLKWSNTNKLPNKYYEYNESYVSCHWYMNNKVNLLNIWWKQGNSLYQLLFFLIILIIIFLLFYLYYLYFIKNI